MPGHDPGIQAIESIVTLADHKDRLICGKCGYTEFNKGGKKPLKTNNETKPGEETEKISEG